jgi:hypothetical protein
VRIFISSTFADLKDYREATLRATQTLGHVGEDMVFWSADERQPADLSLDKVRQSDVLVLLVAHRYGFLPPGWDVSITEAEYRAARAAGIPVLAFFLDEEVPWPPKHVDRDHFDELVRFKERVSKEVTRATFTSPDNLAAQVTQALVLLQGRVTRPRLSLDPLKGRTLTVSAPARLRTDPDVIVPIGESEDGLPLLLRVRRSADLEPTFRELEMLITRPGSSSPGALLGSFRQALADYGATAWAEAHIEPVTMTDGTKRDLYVTRSTLSNLFGSLFTRLLLAHRADVETDFGVVASVRVKRSGGRRVAEVAASSAPAPLAPVLQSAGGANRFLGISPDDGSLHSVGHVGAETTQWRSYLTESLNGFSPVRRLRFLGRRLINIVGPEVAELAEGHPDSFAPEYAETLLDYAVRHAGPDGVLPETSYAIVMVQDLARGLVKVCDAVARLHGSGKVHGDLKAQNILFGAAGPVLIDGFDLAPGTDAPGWTPGWSAPEQMLGLEMTEASDIYPLGIMIGHLIGGILVGEVRKFRTTPARGRTEFDIFYDPVLTRAQSAGPSQKTFAAWADIAARCLRFDSDKRPYTAAELSAAITRLVEEHPLPGARRIELTGRLVAVTLLDGTSAVARILDDVPQLPGAAAPPPPDAWHDSTT